MNRIEMLISGIISKDSDHPVTVEIEGEIPPEFIDALSRVKSQMANSNTPSERSGSEPAGNPAQRNTVTIPVASYAALIRAQTQLDFIQTAYHHNKYSIDDELYCVFGPKVKAEDGDA